MDPRAVRKEMRGRPYGKTEKSMPARTFIREAPGTAKVCLKRKRVVKRVRVGRGFV